ncbi:F-box/kelch-repeat protein [Camellia lanceoleosa]|uniref:F-box/kelch-repeat protein n=1 Tax=Camellia lanceoleosa TaxID=1840588 RepID=A0ACC0IVZ1_9ERIC|nr:F-box/kelch-repeat protein [Camellia lanceoleosa]
MSNFDFPPYKPVGLNDCILGFGFNMKTGNFKVVKAVRFWDEGWVNCVEVYNLNSDSWRVLSDVVKLKGIQISPNMIVSKYTNNNNGVFRWCLYRSIENGIIDEVVVSFDMGEEVFKVTVLPKDYARVMAPTFGKFICNLTLVKGSLAIVCSFFEERHSRLEVWVMKNYEVDESWSLELSVGLDRGLHASLGFWNDNELLILRNPGFLFLEWDGSAFLYNPCISGEPNFIYKESLVSVEGGNIGN